MQFSIASFTDDAIQHGAKEYGIPQRYRREENSPERQHCRATSAMNLAVSHKEGLAKWAVVTSPPQAYGRRRWRRSLPRAAKSKSAIAAAESPIARRTFVRTAKVVEGEEGEPIRALMRASPTGISGCS
jgi:hypothetical protein